MDEFTCPNCIGLEIWDMCIECRRSDLKKEIEKAKKLIIEVDKNILKYKSELGDANAISNL